MTILYNWKILKDKQRRFRVRTGESFNSLQHIKNNNKRCLKKNNEKLLFGKKKRTWKFNITRFSSRRNFYSCKFLIDNYAKIN